VQALGKHGEWRITLMVVVGIVVTLLGFALSVASLGMAASVGGRLIMTLLGIGISLFGIIGLLNPAYMKNAIWKKEARR
jgi:hypothetical protein